MRFQRNFLKGTISTLKNQINAFQKLKGNQVKLVISMNNQMMQQHKEGTHLISQIKQIIKNLF
ncbi:hypothetical protein TTHERM_001227769 (macronuclear) [Tetrahymena thermophila SB210]|uniref:Uncharacterized protein n=1 Tax=Tetrahymena thermophila (strain SB210) TaxID=312017 RepID=W7XEG7_TETTS|nr:hypothetical protein TTHERM_001227769 [Tetrahymena thermophila SB210]EWS75038.1 hypothetical protein TTHERM_001227769 [Tetrahymena thermophila SB210]|eukprot:XP_012652427.1 hypothetical protein TTHERM_001227769 [Tetrahymena thermophila SB210]